LGEVLRSHTLVKVEVPESEYSVTSKSSFKNITQLKVQNVLASNILKVPKVKVLIMQIGPFKNNIYYMF